MSDMALREHTNMSINKTAVTAVKPVGERIQLEKPVDLQRALTNAQKAQNWAPKLSKHFLVQPEQHEPTQRRVLNVKTLEIVPFSPP